MRAGRGGMYIYVDALSISGATQACEDLQLLSRVFPCMVGTSSSGSSCTSVTWAALLQSRNEDKCM